MLFMVIEKFAENDMVPVYRHLRDQGRGLPDGLEYVDSWVDMDYSRCFQVMRTDDPSLFDAWIGAWKDLVRFEVVPVRTSAEAAAAIVQQI